MNYEFEAIENFRDLARGCPCRYGEPAKGVIYRSGSPYYASKEDHEALKKLGIRSVIDLRGHRIITNMPSPFMGKDGIEYFVVEVPNGETYPVTEDDVPGWYMRFLEDPYTTRKFVRAIIQAPKPLLFHCEAGKDRTGVFSALLLLANGAKKEDVVADYLLSYDGRLAETERRTIVEVPHLANFVFHPQPTTFALFLDRFLERYGSVTRYLEAMGLKEGEIDAVSNILGKQEISAGAVVFHENKVLVEHMRLGHYSMPKGHREPTDEDLVATAHREIKEETGLNADIDTRFRAETVYSPRPGVIKRVVWFIADVDNEATIVQPEEVEACYFLSPADALRVLTHDDDRRVLTEACNYRYPEK